MQTINADQIRICPSSPIFVNANNELDIDLSDYDEQIESMQESIIELYALIEECCKKKDK